MTAQGRIAVIGASAAGLAAATGLRDLDYGGEIVLIGAEQRLPYDRPPLSKSGFRSADDCGGIALIDHDEIEKLGIELRLGAPAVRLDPQKRSVIMADGSTAGWDACIIATGATPVRLLGGGRVLRTLDDAVAITAALDSANHVTVIGGGVLGCELAALARGAGTSTLVIEPMAGPMLDRLGLLVSARLAALHRSAGVEFRFGTSVTEIAGGDGTGYRIELSDGALIETDLVLVAVGCRPDTGWLEGSGVPVGDGVECDAFCEALPGVFAAGDVASWFNRRYGRRMRIEHRTNATEQGMAVAEAIAGERRPYDPIPFFWTDQYEARIQVFGVIAGDLDTDVLADDPSSDKLMVAYSRNGMVEGVLGWNMGRSLRRMRTMIGRPRRDAVREAGQTAS